MRRLLCSAATILVMIATALPAAADEAGRTDGPENSEYGSGGYPFGGPAGRFYLMPAFGSGIPNLRETRTVSGLLYGLDLGYERDEWVSIEGSYTFLSDRDLSIYGIGTRLVYPTDPFVFHTSVHAGLYVPEEGGRRFGLAPGAGIDVVVTDRIRLGLNYKHDFIFQETYTQDLDRVCAALKLYF